MCLVLFAFRHHPRYPLVLAANRDEFYDRPAAPAGFWEDVPGILAGRDLKAGGTWMGLTRTGRFAALTNFRDPSNVLQEAPSRGVLVPEYLRSAEPPRAFLERRAEQAHRYNGFNLIVGHPDALFYLSNREGAVRAVKPGLYGLSNHLLDTPWPKVAGGKAALAAALQAETVDPEPLLALLADRTCAPDPALPDTGVGLEWERALSSRFITTAAYGTRASTVLLVDAAGTATFVERTFGRDGEPGETRRYDVRLEWGSDSG